MIIRDIKVYLYQNENQFLTIQEIMGFKLFFKGWVIRNQRNANQDLLYYITKLSKIIIKKSVIY